MNRSLSFLTGTALILLGQAASIRDEFLRSCLLRDDLRELATGLILSIVKVGSLASICGGLLLLSAAMSTLRSGRWGDSVLAPSLCGLFLWAFSTSHSPWLLTILGGALLLCLLGVFRMIMQGVAISPGQATVTVFLLVGLEAAVRQSDATPLARTLFSHCAPDPFRGFLLWCALAVGGLLLGLGLTVRRGRLAAGLAGGALLALVPLSLPRYQLPGAVPPPPDLVWFSGGPAHQKLNMTFPVTWSASAPSNLEEAQDRAVLGGDSRAQEQLWQSILDERPLSLGLRPSEVWEQIWWRQDRGEEIETLMAYLSPLDENEDPGRTTLSGRLGYTNQAAAGRPLRIVSSSFSLRAADRLDDSVAYRRFMWLDQPQNGRPFRLLPCSRAESVLTDAQGRFSFRYVRPGTWSALVGIEPVEVRDGLPHWPPLILDATTKDLKLGFISQRVQSQPADLTLEKLEDSVWARRGSIAPRTGAGVRLGEDSSLLQMVDVRSSRGKTVRVTASVEMVGEVVPDQNASMELELRTDGDSFSVASAQWGSRESPTALLLGHNRLEGAKNFPSRWAKLKTWPRQLTAEIEVGPDKNVLELRFRVGGLTAVKLDGFTYQEVQP